MKFVFSFKHIVRKTIKDQMMFINTAPVWYSWLTGFYSDMILIFKLVHLIKIQFYYIRCRIIIYLWIATMATRCLLGNLFKLYVIGCKDLTQIFLNIIYNTNFHLACFWILPWTRLSTNVVAVWGSFSQNSVTCEIRFVWTLKIHHKSNFHPNYTKLAENTHQHV